MPDATSRIFLVGNCEKFLTGMVPLYIFIVLHLGIVARLFLSNQERRPTFLLVTETTSFLSVDPPSIMAAAHPVNGQPLKPNLKFREPLTWDLTYWFLSRTVFSPLAIIFYPIIVYVLSKRAAPVPSAYPPVSYKLLRSLLSTSSENPYKWIGRAFWFSLFKNGNRLLTRIARNHGVWRADKPDWSKDTVVITGGSAGIGKSVVEILAHEKHAKVAVLDMAPPTYAPAPAGVPEILYFKTDVGDKEQVHAAAEQIRQKHDNPSILINCAGELIAF